MPSWRSTRTSITLSSGTSAAHSCQGARPPLLGQRDPPHTALAAGTPPPPSSRDSCQRRRRRQSCGAAHLRANPPTIRSGPMRRGPRRRRPAQQPPLIDRRHALIKAARSRPEPRQVRRECIVERALNLAPLCWRVSVADRRRFHHSALTNTVRRPPSAALVAAAAASRRHLVLRVRRVRARGGSGKRLAPHTRMRVALSVQTTERHAHLSHTAPPVRHHHGVAAALRRSCCACRTVASTLSRSRSLRPRRPLRRAVPQPPLCNRAAHAAIQIGRAAPPLAVVDALARARVIDRCRR